MKIISSPKALQSDLLQQKRQGKTIAFAPTMGNLHDGHLSLVTLGKKQADLMVSSIFVNPKQFGPNEDFESYPRTLSKDIELLKSVGCDYLLTPTIQDIYPQGEKQHTSVKVNRLTDKLCGASRPGHFEGVTTVVNILLNIVQPDIAIFGKKDYQQLQVIRAMVNDLFLPIKIIGAEISRTPDGLALSSRNGYLTENEKKQAVVLRQTLLWAKQQILANDTFQSIVKEAHEKLNSEGFTVDYFEIVRQSNLEIAINNNENLLIAAAAWLGKPRLIDNLEVNFSDS